MDELKIREMEQDEDFAVWFSELAAETEEAAGWGNPVSDRYLVLSNEIGDWIGGLRFSLRGGVANLLEVAVVRLGEVLEILPVAELLREVGDRPEQRGKRLVLHQAGIRQQVQEELFLAVE